MKGHLVFWDINGLVKVDYLKAIELSHRYKLDINFPRIDFRGLFTRNVINKLGKPFIGFLESRGIENDCNYAVYVIVNSINKETAKIIVCSDGRVKFAGVPEIIKLVKERLENISSGCGDLNWLIRMIVRFLTHKCYAIRTRENGGIYFIRTDYEDIVNRFRGFLLEIARQSGFRIDFYIVNCDDNKLEEWIKAGLNHELENIHKEIIKWFNTSKRRIRITSRSALDRLELIKEMKEKLLIYHEIIDVEKEIEKLTNYAYEIVDICKNKDIPHLSIIDKKLCSLLEKEAKT